jgi:hypothetical protein
MTTSEPDRPVSGQLVPDAPAPIGEDVAASELGVAAAGAVEAIQRSADALGDFAALWNRA